VVVTTGWDGRAAEDVAAYDETLRQLASVARAAGAAGVIFLQYPVTQPLLQTQAQVHTTVRQIGSVVSKIVPGGMVSCPSS